MGKKRKRRALRVPAETVEPARDAQAETEAFVAFAVRLAEGTGLPLADVLKPMLALEHRAVWRGLVGPAGRNRATVPWLGPRPDRRQP